ncbi:DNA-directed DNA polymerase gamma mip1 [Zalerion maritima]|uniref:DNA-directed DNA polymerase n=1 Tax=Zalerion maritima TaxID=339359 RepID=A0AAD5RU36_9PEZI|nr:DNA-directed DNA polymerase gamma mip1 [Zalerion maritima]
MLSSPPTRLSRHTSHSLVRLARIHSHPLRHHLQFSLAPSNCRYISDVSAAANDPPERAGRTSLASEYSWMSVIIHDAWWNRGANMKVVVKSSPRYNEIGIQHLSSHIYPQIFQEPGPPPPPSLIELSKDHLRRHNLLGKNNDNADPVAFDLPALQGRTMDEHFHKLGMDCGEPFLSMAKRFARADVPPKPRKWVSQSGWTKYHNDGKTKPEKVAAPDEDLLCFDVEVMWKESPFAVMACAAGPSAWYAWLSPWLLGESKSDRHLIPLGDPTKERIIVGHNIGYDRSRILEEYSLKQTRNAFVDTMSLHVAVNGMCSQQRPTWMKHKKNRELRDKLMSESNDMQLSELLTNSAFREEEELWVERSSVNSLRDVAKFHLNVTIDKAVRNDFGELDREGVLGKLDELLDYCAADVAVTHKVYQVVFTNFLDVCPHPVSFAALRHLSNVILPVNEAWETYITNSEATYHRLSDAVQERLLGLKEKALAIKGEPDKWKDDPWLMQLDWSGQEIRMVKGKKKNDPPRPAARQKMPGMPKWYKDLFPKTNSPINLTVRTRVAPLLLRLSWEGNPLFWSDKYGWTFRVPVRDMDKYMARQAVFCDMSDEKIEMLRDTHTYVYFKLPHKDGPTSRCANPLAKSYLAYFESGTLSSEFSYAKEALEMNASCSYWISARARIKSQIVVYQKELDSNHTGSQGFILPQVIPMGTITRRAVENTWLTASNAKRNRVGSELKAMVKAPPGYCFVGADVDSEELWIASLVGDATFKLHGGNSIGFMTLEGTKAAGTDLHSRTASILGTTRNNAKIFNYGRIYGAGLKFASTLLRQFNHSMSDKETNEIATKLYSSTKGAKTNRKAFSARPFWRGGTESFVFNKLEEFAEQDRPRTPVLGAGITEALMGRFINKGGFLTSRINWAIQSSGVDYLHLLIVSMDYLTRRFAIDARLAITVHDEIRYLVKDCDKYRAAMALQVANIWTRAMFAQQMGIDDLPQACAFFSAVDIDSVLRKEVDLDCVTPSHPDSIPPGESLDIYQLLEKGDEACLDPNIVPSPEKAPRLDGITYTPRAAVMKNMDGQKDSSSERFLNFIKAQITSDDEELKELDKQQRKLVGPTTKRTTKKSGDKGVFPYINKAVMMQTDLMHEPLTISDTFKQRFKNYGRSQSSSYGMSSKAAAAACYKKPPASYRVDAGEDPIGSSSWAPEGPR